MSTALKLSSADTTMSTFCISGSSIQDVKIFDSVLKSFGVSTAKPSNHDKKITMEYWHEALIEFFPLEANAKSAATVIGEVWKELAINIWLANQTQKNWSWAEPSNLSILNFWSKIDHKIIFIIVYTPLKRVLQQIIHDPRDDSPQAIQEKVNQWQKENENLEIFHNENRHCCLIINIEDLYVKFQEFSVFLKDKWNLIAPSEKPTLSNHVPEISEQLIGSLYNKNSSLKEMESRLLAACCTLNSKATKKTKDSTPKTAKTLAKRQGDDSIKLAELSLLLQETTKALHKTQEEFLATFFEKEKTKEQLKFYDSRLRSMQANNPKNYEFEDLIITHTEDTTYWNFKNIYINNRFLQSLKFRLNIENKIAGIILEREDKETITVIPSWPHPYVDSILLDCTPASGGALQANNLTLSSISTEGWASFIELVALLKKITDNKHEKIPTSINKKLLSEAIDNLQKTLINWPTTLRYDQVEITETVANKNYQKVSLRLNNINIGQYFFDRLDYSFSSYNSENENFGTHPRLEFPPASAEVFENWFEESSGTLGPRLELRFAHPNMMDTNVLYKLSESDQVLMFGLISSLERQIEESSQRISYDRDTFKKWVDLAKAIKMIASKAIVGYIRTTPIEQNAKNHKVN